MFQTILYISKIFWEKIFQSNYKMYNGKIIKELLDRKNIPYGDLLRAIGMNPKQTSVNSLVTGNPSAKRLEAIADFLGVTIDTLFIREGVEMSTEEELKSLSITQLRNQVAHLREQLQFREEMLKEKEERLKEKEARIQLLEKLNDVISSSN